MLHNHCSASVNRLNARNYTWKYASCFCTRRYSNLNTDIFFNNIFEYWVRLSSKSVRYGSFFHWETHVASIICKIIAYSRTYAVALHHFLFRFIFCILILLVYCSFISFSCCKLIIRSFCSICSFFCSSFCCCFSFFCFIRFSQFSFFFYSFCS